ncbi:MAG: hypothetical protein HY900_03820 [Deltaproteobacteria bacterium]|nr:hypothetical protein [Deltaproteobacteria bacterium]
MKKSLVAAVCTTLAVGTALPAFALTSEITGFLRQKGIVADVQLEGNSNKRPDWLVDQRLRAKWTAKVNDYLSFVYFGEVDFSFGDGTANSAAQPVGRNTGGGQDGDATSLETKNLYLVAKIPNTPLTITSGLQGFADNWELVLTGFDMAGIRADATNLGNVANVTLGWFKLAEGEAAEPSLGGQFRNEDDVNLWTLRAALKPMGALKLGADAYYLQNQDPAAVAHVANGLETPGGREDLWFVGPSFSYKAGRLDISGWAFYEFGKRSQAVLDAAGVAQDVDVSAWVASAKVATSGKNWGVGARAIFYSADDDASDKDQTFIRNPMGQVINQRGAASALLPNPVFGGEGLNLLLGDGTSATGYVPGATAPHAGNGIAIQSATQGFGLIGLVVNGVYTPPTMPALYVKGAVGYFQALEEDRNLNNTNLANAPDLIKDHDGKVIGTEVSVRVGYKIAKNLDVSVSGAQAWLGDFFNKTATNRISAVGTTPAVPGTSSSLFGATKVDPDNPFIAYWLTTLTF